MPDNAGGKGWIAFVVVNLFATFAGLSYLFFPLGSVEEDGNQTTGVIDVERHVWGGFVVLCALVLLVVAVTGYRRGERWAWYAAFAQFVFLAIVAAVEPDTFTPVVFGIVLAVVMWRGRHRFRPSMTATG